MSEKKKILVTGADGFVGSAVVNAFQNAGNYEIYGLNSRRKETDAGNGAVFSKLFCGNIADSEILQKAEELNKAGILIHTAGLVHRFGRLKREDFWRVNVQGTENICRLAQKISVEHFVLISSVAVYGDYGAAEINETFECRPEGFYAESKLESERRAFEFCERYKIRLTILRLATVIGEGDRGNTMRLITSIDRGRFIWIGDGSNKKSLIYKADAAEGILKAAEAKADGGPEIYNLTSKAVPMRAVVETISATLKKKIPRLRIPEKVIRSFFPENKKRVSIRFPEKYEKTIRKWLSDDIFSGKKFYEKHNFKPETTVAEALEREVEYYLKHEKGK